MTSGHSSSPGRRAIGLARKAEIDRLALIARWSIRIIGGSLVLAFAWLQFKDLPFIPILESAQPAILLKAILTIYYSCWVFGLGFDISTQQMVYIEDPNKGRMTWNSVGSIFLLTLVAGLLFWASGNEQYFAGVLNVFVMTNIILWLLFLKRVRIIIQASKDVYLSEREYFELERVSVVESYIAGDWQWHRFIAMCTTVLTADAICFVAVFRQKLSTITQLFLPELPNAVISSLLPDASFIVFIAVAEGWIWMMRAKTRASLYVVDLLKAKYTLTPLSDV
jgi:hypothetical protein